MVENFVKAMDGEGSRFTFLQGKFPWICMDKLKAGIIDGPQIRELMYDVVSDETLSNAELSTRQSLKSVFTNSLENHRNTEYKKEIKEILKSLRQLRAWMQIKLHFLCSHLDYFPKNCRDFCEEQGERFHQDIRIKEESYYGRWDVNLRADHCLCLKWDVVATENIRKFLKRSNSCITSLVYFSGYYGTMWVSCES